MVGDLPSMVLSLSVPLHRECVLVVGVDLRVKHGVGESRMSSRCAQAQGRSPVHVTSWPTAAGLARQRSCPRDLKDAYLRETGEPLDLD
ncbi:hypothetical protein D7Y15_35135 [Corallococcus sp. AB030]|nr:hypothetical protein D7Y15_35135 [Corallococcus sp. AB030]